MVYNTAKVTDNVTIDKILAKLDPYDIYAFYIGKEVKLNKPINSPLREDKNPSWTLFKARSGDLMYKDFATGESGNVVHLVRHMFDITYYKALEKIWADMMTGDKQKNGHTRPKTERVNKIETELTVKRKYFTQVDDEYWGQFYITRDILKLYNVFPIQMYWHNGVQGGLTYSKLSPMYAYKVFDKFKIYRPYAMNKRDKWRNNCGSYDLQGLEQLPESGKLLIITKSLKDVMVLHRHGYASVAPQSENSIVPMVLMEHLRTRFEKIIVFFDYDEGGVRGAETLCKRHDLEKIFIDKHYLDVYGIKDISDFASEMSKEKTIKLLKELFDGEKN